MEVILLERIDKLGQMGDVVKVKSGYARNYLLPQKKALRATEANKSNFEQQRTQLEASNLERRQEAEKLSKKMEGLAVILIRQAGEGGQLYGSVNARDMQPTHPVPASAPPTPLASWASPARTAWPTTCRCCARSPTTMPRQACWC